MKIELRANEKLIKQSGANLQRGAETVGGRLFLTDQRLYFDTHAFNVATGSEDIELSQITNTSPTWTMFLGIIPIFPNSLRVSTHDGKQYDFVVFDRELWKAEIDKQAGLRV